MVEWVEILDVGIASVREVEARIQRRWSTLHVYWEVHPGVVVIHTGGQHGQIGQLDSARHQQMPHETYVQYISSLRGAQIKCIYFKSESVQIVDHQVTTIAPCQSVIVCSFGILGQQ